MLTTFSSAISTPSSIVGEQNRIGSFPVAELVFALLALLGRHLRGVLARLESLTVGRDVPVEVDEERVRAAAVVGWLRHSDRVVEPARTVAGVPAHRARLDLITRAPAVLGLLVYLLDQPGDAQRFEQARR